MANKGKIRHAVRRNVLFAVLGGIVVLAVTLFISARADMAATAHMLSVTTEYVKEQCNHFAKIDLASETKSLMRVIESGKQIAHGIAADRALGQEQALEAYARDSYVSGVYLLDGDGGIDAQYHSESDLPDALDEALATRALLDTALHPEKRYADRFHCTDGSDLDVAATAREDAVGVVAVYYHTPASYKNSFSLSAASLLDGYTMEKGGTIAIGSGDTIVASNDLSLIGAKTADVPILRALSLLSDGDAKMCSARRGDSVSHDFGLMKRGHDFYIYGYVAERDMFSNTPRTLLYTLLVYIALLALIHTVYWQLVQRYREKQVRTQAEYTDRLRRKNEQLSIAIENAARANAAKSGFLSRMSHDIRTPLNGILGLLRISDMHADDTALLADNRRKIKIAADHLLSLVNDVLQMSKLESGEAVLAHERICLSDLRQDIADIVIGRAEESGITWDCPDEGAELPYPYVYGSPLHLRQIFLNIYSNCIKYNRPGGRITTVLDMPEASDGRCTYRWRISDTGIGMSEAYLNHIFEAFSQEKNDARSVYSGTGLGMSIVKGLLDRMGGRILITSKVGVGSTFEISIPFEIAPAPETPPETETQEADIRGLHLLLAEDNALNAEIAVALLSAAGADVTAVQNGKQALERFADSAPGSFDAILMDVMMPVMDGLAATKAIRALDRLDAAAVPIIAMTANVFAEDAEKCFAAGMNAHLTKPLDIAVLKACICEQTAGKTKHR